MAPSPSSRSAAAAARRAMLKPTGQHGATLAIHSRLLSHPRACRPAGGSSRAAPTRNQAHRGRCCRPRTAASTKWSRGRLRQRAPAPGSGTACPQRPRLRPQQFGRGKRKVRHSSHTRQLPMRTPLRKARSSQQPQHSLAHDLIVRATHQRQSGRGCSRAHPGRPRGSQRPAAPRRPEQNSRLVGGTRLVATW